MIFQREILDTAGSNAFALGLLVIAEDSEDDEFEEYCFRDILIQQFLAARHLVTQKVSAHGILCGKIEITASPQYIHIHVPRYKVKAETLSAKK